jgi:hypothetical protein
VVAQARPELEWAEWASECCTTWGSFGYLLSALCQWYASIGPTGEVVSLEELREMGNLLTSFAERGRGGIREEFMGMGQQDPSGLPAAMMEVDDERTA